MKKRRGENVARSPRRRWLGGFVRETASGKPVYVIEKYLRGAYFKASTRCHTESGALKELAKFEADPALYVSGKLDALIMTPELVLEYRDWQLTERGNTDEWARWSASMLAHWMRAIGNRDLRRLKASDVREMLLAFKTNRPARVVALKGFYSWLVKEKSLLEHHQNPMPGVRIPQRGKSRDTAPRDHPYALVRRVYEHLREDVRDILQLQVGTGLHLSEVMRFAQSGELRKDPTGKALAVLVTWHKRKEKAAVALTKRKHVDAARRIREKGYTLGRSRLAYLIRRANIEADIPPEQWVYFGDMRHSVSTWAHEMGEDVANTAKAFNHTDEEMLRRHYVRHAIPRATIKTRTL
jgi:site-specific recombinase XerC